jgi:hypothetical protein
MDRITGNTVNLGGGRRGFRARNLSLGQAGTIVTAAHLNAVQEELMAVIEAAGLTPSSADLDQLLQAILLITPGRLVGVQVFTASGTYIPTPGAKIADVEVQAGGGGGGGAPAAGTGQISGGAPGSAGSYGWGRYPITGPVPVTIGAGGAGGVGANGSPGGASSFGTLLTTIGGNAGAITSPTSIIPIVVSNVETQPGSGGLINAGGAAGQPSLGLSTTATQTYGGSGGNSRFGAGGGTIFGSVGSGRAGVGRGAGGSGTANGQNNANQTGGAGSPGIVIVREYS